jgi:zinc ribbon protein
MNEMAFCSKCGATLAEDAQFCHKCGTPVGGAKTVPPEVHQSFKVKGTPRIVVRTSVGGGSVVMKSAASGEVAVDMKLRGPEHLGYDLSQNGNEILVRVWPLLHPAVSWFYHLGTGVPRADITVAAPAECDVEVDGAVSDISITGLKGNLAAESAVSSIRFENCEGRLRARSRTGSLEIQNFKGDVTARSNVGSIIFSGSLTGQGENFFRTNVGSIQLTLRGKHDLTAELLSNIGGIVCTPELTDPHRDYGRYQGKIGSGTGRLTAQTNTGSINLAQTA